MPKKLLLLLLMCGVTACRLGVEFEDGFTYGCSDGGTTQPPDLLPPIPKCAAAKGLSGDPLTCVDFSTATIAALTNDGWNFNNPPDCWEIANSRLQIKNFGGFASSCGFTTKALSPADYQKYASFTLSIVHRVHVDGQQQRAQIMLGGDDQDNRLLTWMTGKQPRSQWTQTVLKSDLPSMALGSFQPLFKITSGAMTGTLYQGWQIESIAILGNP